jgi:peptidoglycan/LPS O-acetylase OafA/YrhL
MATPSQHHGFYRPDIDGLRAVAVLSVIANHVSPYRVSGGYVGVDVFFVISGFLITGIILQKLQNGTFTFADFYARRVRRIFPALSLVLAASLVTGWFVLEPAAYEDLGANTAAGAGFVSNLLLWKQTSYFGPAAAHKPLLHLWSLGIEEQYYALWPLLLATLWKLRNRLVPIAAIALASFVANVVLSTTRPTAAFYSPATRMWELALGSMIAYVGLTRGDALAIVAGRAIPVDEARRRVFERRLRVSAAWAGIVLIIVAVAFLPEDATFPGYWVLLPTVGTALLICAGPDAWINRTLLSNPLVILIGLISYPLYLWHWPVLTLMHINYPDATRLAKVGAMLGVFVVAWLTYRFVETPIRRNRGVRVVAGLSLSQALLFVSGLALVGLGGIPNRFDAAHQKLFAIGQDEAHYSAMYPDKGTCFLLWEQGENEFSQDCFGRPPSSIPSNRTLLWGDSFAAHLIPGIEATIGKNVSFTKLTAAACSPSVAFVGLRQAHCRAINGFVLNWIRQNKPRVVLLAAQWDYYSGYADVEPTIRELKSLGIEQVVLVGSSAEYERPVPKLLAEALDKGAIPRRLQSPRLPSLLAIDSVLRAVAARAGAEFVSPLAAQCTRDGCLVTLDGSPESVTIWDSGHLTLVGSRFVAERVLLKFLRE